MKNKFLALVVVMCMALTMIPGVALAAGPDMTGAVINVAAADAQDVLDGKYGDINGKTINFTENITAVLDLARPTKYEGSKTVYYNYVSSVLQTTPTPWSDNISSIMNSHSHYYRTLSNVTFTANPGVTVAGFTFSAGHVASSGYDYVRDVAQTTGVTYYKHSSLDGIVFDGLTVTGRIDFKLYLDGCVVNNITVKDCEFTGKTDNSDNAAVKMLADNQYFTDITVENCTIDNYNQGVYIQAADGAEIASNKITNTSHNAIALQSHSVPAKGKVIVKENYIENAGDRAIRFNNIDNGAEININNNIMLNSGDDEEQLIKAGTIGSGAAINLENNYWDGKDLSKAVATFDIPTSTGVVAGNFPVDPSPYMASGFYVTDNGDGTYSVSDTAPAPAPSPDTSDDPDDDKPTEKPASSGISVKYNGGNSFSTSKSDVPTGVEIDGVAVPFSGTGSNFTVGCVDPGAKWVTVRWNSTSVTTNFTPDGLVECSVSIPKTGDMPVWAAVLALFGF